MKALLHENSVQNLPEIPSAQQVAGALGINIKTLYGMTERNEIPHRRAGRKLLFYRETLIEWLRGGQSRVSE